MTQTALHQPQPKPASRPAWTAPPARSSLLQRKCACGGTTGASGECEECRGKKLQRRAAGQTPVSGVPAIVHEVLAAPGRPLDARTRGFFEPRFGHDFSGVRIHDDARAAASARAVDAHAYTVGQDIAFAASRFPARGSLAAAAASLLPAGSCARSPGTAKRPSTTTLSK